MDSLIKPKKHMKPSAIKRLQRRAADRKENQNNQPSSEKPLTRTVIREPTSESIFSKKTNRVVTIGSIDQGQHMRVNSSKSVEKTVIESGKRVEKTVLIESSEVSKPLMRCRNQYKRRRNGSMSDRVHDLCKSGFDPKYM